MNPYLIITCGLIAWLGVALVGYGVYELVHVVVR